MSDETEMTKAQAALHELMARVRASAINECALWLMSHHGEYKSEYLAGNMAGELLGESEHE